MSYAITDLTPFEAQRLQHSGFASPSECAYGVFDVDGMKWVIFVELHKGTSITNMIEHLATMVYNSDLSDVPPEQIRWFEYYTPKYQPIVDWQEVGFGENGVSAPEHKPSAFERFLVALGLRKPTVVDRRAYFYDPVWRSVRDDGLKSKLLWLIYVDKDVAKRLTKRTPYD